MSSAIDRGLVRYREARHCASGLRVLSSRPAPPSSDIGRRLVAHLLRHAMIILLFVALDPAVALAQEETQQEKLQVTSQKTLLSVGESVQLTVTHRLAEGTVVDLTAASTFTHYGATDPDVLTVDQNGLVVALTPGEASIIVGNFDEEADVADVLVGHIDLTVGLLGDADADGLPDTYERARGFDPADSADADDDVEGDGLTNLVEFQRGTNPRLFDTERDGLPDGLEVAGGTDPLSFTEAGQLSSHCLASVSNRTVRVSEDGTFVIPNVPSGAGLLRVSFVCDRGGSTLRGRSDFFLAPPSGAVTVTGISLQAPDEIPVSIRLQASHATLTQPGATAELSVQGVLPDGSTRDLTSRNTGTTYSVSNPSIATVGSDVPVRVTAISEGTVTVAALNQGTLATVMIQVTFGLDADGDGLPDIYESERSCLDAAVPDGAADPDADGLTSRQEFDLGSEPCQVDTDGDGLNDGTEAAVGSSPVLPDSDLDGVSDGTEPAGDNDGDGVANVVDSDSDNDGLRDGLEVRVCGTIVCADPQADNDGDGIRNLDEAGLFTDPLDPDSDDDGLTDSEEVLALTDPLVPDRMPPVVTLLAPAVGIDLVEGEQLTVRVDTSDDGRVTQVAIRIDGNIEASPAEEPFDARVQVPIDITSLRIEAVATDTNANAGSSGEQVHAVIEDPRTTMAGTVLDTNGAAVAGATARVRLPDVPVEAGVADFSGAAFVIEPLSGAGASSLSGTLTNDAGILPFLGEAVDLEPAGALTLSGALTLDFKGFNPLSPTPRSGTLGLSGAAPTGLALSLSGPVEGFLPAAGERPFAAELDVTTFDSAGQLLADPLAGFQMRVHVQGTVRIETTPATGVVTSIAFSLDLDQTALLDFSAVSGADGIFSIEQVPTIFGDIIVNAELKGAGGLLRRGSSNATPSSRGGITDVGDITLRLLPRARRDYPVGTSPFDLSVGDINGDGRTDVVAANANSHDLSVLLSNGDGTFQPERRVPAVGLRPRGIGIGDFNGDGKADLAVANENSINVRVLLGDSTGFFTLGQTYAIASSRPQTVAVGDFDKDQILDLAVAPSGDAVAVLLGRGDGTFDPPVRVLVAAGAGPLSVAIGDFNGDTNPDLVTANNTRNNVSIVRGNGDGTFQTSQEFPVGDRPRGLSVGELNGDGRLDVVVTNTNDHNFSVLLGNGDGTLQAARNFTTGTSPRWVAIGDLHGDGFADLLVTSTGQDNLWLHRGLGDGTFQTTLQLRTGPDPDIPAVLNLNGDAALDVIISVGSIHTVSAMIGKGDGAFEMNTTFVTENEPHSIDAGDVNNDGELDVVLLHSGSNRVAAFPGRGDGTFAPRLLSIVTSGTGMMLADFDEDGNQDLVAANFSGPVGSIFVPLGNGDGTFTVFQQSILTMGDRTNNVTVDDLDRDGNLDIVATNRDSNNISVRLGTGGLTFQNPVHYAVGTLPIKVRSDDFNGDGRVDLAVGNYGTSNVSILLGVGDGTFQSAQSFPVAKPPQSIAVGDLDRDGLLDVVTANNVNVTGATDGISILFGQGDGTFEPPVEMPLGRNLLDIRLADLNADRFTDIILSNGDGNNVIVLLGKGDGTFRAPTYFGGQATCTGVVVGDFNRDGVPDLVFGNLASDELSIIYGRGDGTF